MSVMAKRRRAFLHSHMNAIHLFVNRISVRHNVSVSLCMRRRCVWLAGVCCTVISVDQLFFIIYVTVRILIHKIWNSISAWLPPATSHPQCLRHLSSSTYIYSSNLALVHTHSIFHSTFSSNRCFISFLVRSNFYIILFFHFFCFIQYKYI